MDYNKLLNENVIKIIESLRKEKLYFSQIYEKTGIKSKNNILKNLEKMAKLNVLKKDKGKGNTFYTINYDNLVAIGLLELNDTLRLQRLPLERRNSIIETISELKPLIAILFGSTAKGNFRKESDIDLLLVFNKEIDKKGEKIKEIGSKYGVKINPVMIKFSEFDTKNETINHILKTGFPGEGFRYFYGVRKYV